MAGKGIPYEKVCLVVAIVTTVVLSLLLGNNIAREVPVSIIDLDHSKYSLEMAQKIDSSPSMKIKHIVYTPENPETFLYQDQSFAVIVFPKDMEKNAYSGAGGTIGLFVDNTNTALDADIRSEMNTIIGTENGIAAEASGATGGSFSLSERVLFNPTGSSSNGEVQGFLFFFSSMFFTFATIGMVPRLKLTHEWEPLLATGNPFLLAVKLLPYMGCLLVAFFVGMAILRLLGNMVFAGNIFAFFVTQMLYLPLLGLMSLLFGWTASDPGIANSRMILLIPGGFILGGATAPISLYEPWVVWVSHFFPLTWEFHFVRDIILRGAGLSEMTEVLGAFLLYLAAVALVFCFVFEKSRKQEGLVASNQ